MYYTSAELVKKEAKTRVAILLHCAGPEAQRSSKSIGSPGKMRCLNGISFGSVTNTRVKPLTNG